MSSSRRGRGEFSRSRTGCRGSAPTGCRAPWWRCCRTARSVLGTVAASRARYPGAAAFVSPHGRLTYQDLWRSSTALARGLAGAGGRRARRPRRRPVPQHAAVPAVGPGRARCSASTWCSSTPGLPDPSSPRSWPPKGSRSSSTTRSSPTSLPAFSANGIGTVRSRELVEASSTKDLPPPHPDQRPGDPDVRHDRAAQGCRTALRGLGDRGRRPARPDPDPRAGHDRAARRRSSTPGG